MTQVKQGKLPCVVNTPLAVVWSMLKFSLEIDLQKFNFLVPYFQGFEINLSGAASSGAKGPYTQCCVSDKIW